MIDRKILEILVCPVAKTELRYDEKKQELISDRAKLAYKIKNGVPDLNAERARHLENHEIKK